jgi:TolA-binding protein
MFGMMSGKLPKYFSKAIIGATSSASGKAFSQRGKNGKKNNSVSDVKHGGEGNGKNHAPEILDEKLTALSKQLIEVEAEKLKLQEQLENASALVLIADDTVTLRDGYTYQVGEEIDSGRYKGKKFIKLNWKRRSATLDDGTVLKLGF